MNDENVSEGAGSKGLEFKYSMFPSGLIKKIPSSKKLRAFASRFDYEVKVNDEKRNMEIIVSGFQSKEMEFRMTYAPVKWGREAWPEEPEPIWYVYERKSASIAYAHADMESCICGFIFLLGTFGKREAIRRTLDNKKKLRLKNAQKK